jgi:DNA sulfur modification protein DndE
MKLIKLFIIILLLQIAVNARQITVYLAGDSTMANKAADKRPETGWGEYLGINFDETKIKVENHAQNGRSTKSFINEGRWQKIVDSLKKGDYVFIEFGHNDEKLDKPEVGAAANTDYRNNLIRFVNDVRAKKAFPILLTPVMRRRFDEKGEFYDTHGEYPDAVRKVATELKVPLIDLHKKTGELLIKYGAEESKKLFLQLKEGEHPNYPKGIEDNTHFNQRGAEEVAKLAIEEIRAKKIKLRKYLKKL